MKRALLCTPDRGGAAAQRLHARIGEHRARAGCRRTADAVPRRRAGSARPRAHGKRHRRDVCRQSLCRPDRLPRRRRRDGRAHARAVRGPARSRSPCPTGACGMCSPCATGSRGRTARRSRRRTLSMRGTGRARSSDAAAPYLFACIDGYGTGRLNVTASADGRTLTVVLAEAMPTFLQLCAQPAYAPVPSGAADTTSWTADGAAFVTSGPYTVAAWTTEGLTYTKKSRLLGRGQRCGRDGALRLSERRPTLRRPPSSRANTRSAGRYRMTRSTTCGTNHAPELRTVSQLGTYSLCFSMSDPALSAFSQTERAQIRTALALLIDRDALCAARSRPAHSRARTRPYRPASRTPTAAPSPRTTARTARAAVITAAITRPTASRPSRSCGRRRSRPAGSRSARRACAPGSRS